jgi:hypothetical protein
VNLKVKQPGEDRLFNQVGEVIDAELLHYVAAMDFNCPLGAFKTLGYFYICPAFEYKVEDTFFDF